MALTPLLGRDDPAPVGVRNGESQSPFFFICDHAGNADMITTFDEIHLE